MFESKHQDTGASGKKLLRISDLAKAAGVPPATIHYYVKEGLLSPAKKTARNMAYYSPESVDDIRFIKELQAKRYLPLSVIKMMLAHKHEGQSADHVAGMETLLNDIFHPVSPEEVPRSLSFSELVSASGLPVSHLLRLEALELISPITEGQHKKYDDLDLRVTRIVKELDDFGIKPWDLHIYSDFLVAIRNEIKTVHNKLHENKLTGTADVGKLMDALNNLKACLATRIYRQAALTLHE